MPGKRKLTKRIKLVKVNILLMVFLFGKALISGVIEFSFPSIVKMRVKNEV